MKNYQEIIELNENSKLKYKLGETNLDILKENSKIFERVNNFMSLDFFLPNLKERKQIIKFYGFPTDEDEMCLASYYSTSYEENVFGIKIGSNIKMAEKILLSYGYLKTENAFTKGKVKIVFECDTDKVTSFDISLESKYLGNRLY